MKFLMVSRIRLRECKTTSQSGFTLVEMIVVAALIGLLATIAISTLARARQASQTKACINNLRIIEAAKQEWASEADQRNGIIPNTFNTVSSTGRIGSVLPHCPIGGVGYNLGNLSSVPVCLNYNANSHNAFISK
jgi:prepilin-type N-terminal cleavage/methylation domain-containing protein